MQKLNFRLILIFLFPIAILLNYLASLNPLIIEKHYSSTINKTFIKLISNITNFIPFSLYDVTILTTVLIFILYFVIILVKIRRKQTHYFILIKGFVLNCLAVLSIAYFLFISLWGLNYNRIPFNESMGIKSTKHSLAELTQLYEYLIMNLNKLRTEVAVDINNISTITEGYRDVFNRAPLGYEIASEYYPTLSGNYGSPKPFIFSYFFNYTGITGVYFPYTGQAGVAINVPSFTIPFTTLHEMAHQRGYAQEDEANFIAFVTSTFHPDADFKYSGYMAALSYTSNAIYKEDPILLKELNSKLSDDVKRDVIYRIDFWEKYQGKINTIASGINDTYLKSNGVNDGEKSYGRMVDLLLDYYIKLRTN